METENFFNEQVLEEKTFWKKRPFGRKDLWRKDLWKIKKEIIKIENKYPDTKKFIFLLKFWVKNWWVVSSKTSSVRLIDDLQEKKKRKTKMKK